MAKNTSDRSNRADDREQFLSFIDKSLLRKLKVLSAEHDVHAYLILERALADFLCVDHSELRKDKAELRWGREQTTSEVTSEIKSQISKT
jgi:hypothetical protein